MNKKKCFICRKRHRRRGSMACTNTETVKNISCDEFLYDIDSSTKKHLFSIVEGELERLVDEEIGSD